MKSRTAFAVVALLSAVAAQACQTADNLVPNCGFDSAFDGWQNETAATCAPDSSSGVTTPANITCNSFAGMFGHVLRFRRCLTAATGVQGGKTYLYSAYAQRVSGTGVTCTVEAADFTSDNCMFNVNAVTTPLAPADSPNYAQSTAATYTVAANTVSMHVRLECHASAAFQLRFDDVYVGLGDPIFKNGFE
jgi:hypothetical protein